MDSFDDLLKLVLQSESHFPCESATDVYEGCKYTKDHYLCEFAIFVRNPRSALQSHAAFFCLVEIEVSQRRRGVDESGQCRILKPMRLISELFRQPADSFFRLLAPPVPPPFVERPVSSRALDDLLSLSLNLRVSVFRQGTHYVPPISVVVSQEELRGLIATGGYPANLVFRLS